MEGFFCEYRKGLSFIMPFDRNKYMREYMRKRRETHPGIENIYKERALKRKLAGLLEEMTVSDLEKLIQQKRERLAAAQEGRRDP